MDLRDQMDDQSATTKLIPMLAVVRRFGSLSTPEPIQDFRYLLYIWRDDRQWHTAQHFAERTG
jgi:hypothetical protein